MTQWAVAVRPDATQRVILVGPFGSEEKAVRVSQSIEDVEQMQEEKTGMQRDASLAPEVLRLQHVTSFMADLWRGDV